MNNAMSASRGFSLVEMLVALVILSLSLGVLYQAAMGATRNVRVSGEYSEALILAESLMAQHFSPEDPELDVSGVNGPYRWQVQAVPMMAAFEVPAAGGFFLLDVRVTVLWGESGRDRQVQLATIAPFQALPQ